MIAGMTDATSDPYAILLPDDPLELLRAAQDAGPGWSAAYGGPEGVAVLAEAARQAVMAQAGDLAALRRVAIAELCRDRHLADIGRSLGISKAAVHKLHREVDRQPHELDRLLSEGIW